MDNIALVICITVLLVYSYFMERSYKKVETAFKEYIKELEKRVKIYEDYVDNNEGN